tara:strand:- start:2090 stop:2293 length:204 start_codon:yes stop_codon:yes gene_type:complete
MDYIINKIIEKVSDRRLNRTKYRVKRLKTISGVIHAVIADVKDENSEMLVAISVLEDKSKFKILKLD